MNRDIHERALRSAAQVAFLTLAAGCGASAVDAEDSVAEQAIRATDESLAPSATGCHDPKTNKECKAALHAAYPNGDNEWWGEGTKREPTPVSTEALVACCKKLYPSGFATGGQAKVDAIDLGTFRDLGCCSATREVGEFAGIACTPWGPPMPPAMRRRARSLA